jgi:D-sedoheptulose 7-phosphate isomerase
MSLPVAILAGGLGTRLASLSADGPKALIDVAGKPFIHHQVELLRSRGIDRIVLCVGYRGEEIRSSLGDGRELGVFVRYSCDGDVPLGTAGALKKALPLLGDRFFVLYGDSYLDIDHQAVQSAFESSGSLGLMTVFANEGRWDTSNVHYEDNRIVRYDKHDTTAAMRHIDYGLGMLHKEALDLVVDGQESDLADLYTSLVARGQLAAFEVTRRFYEAGSPEGLEETRAHLVEKAESEMSYPQKYLSEAAQILADLDVEAIERLADQLAAVRARKGRLFCLGVGGSATNASHAVNDFRKIVGIETYAPTDNVAELTARINDDGWATAFADWLRVSRLSENDMVLVLSVGGGDLERNVSPSLVRALELARERGAAIAGIVGRDGGYTARVADVCVVIPTVDAQRITPHTEAFQAVIWHLLVSHPKLQVNATKWESVV